MSVSFDQAVMEGLDASKPAASAGTVGRLYFATDTGILYRDNGSAWVERANDLQLGTTATTAAAGNDSRLSDARTPTAHAASHHTAGSDPLAAADIGAEPALGNPAVDNYVLKSTAAGVRSWAAESGGGGGGSTISSGTAASRPAAGTAGNLYLPTDAPVLYRDNGSAWVGWGPLFPLTAPPAAATFTAQSAGAATLTDSAGGLSVQTTGNDNNPSGYTVALPSAPWTFIVGLMPLLIAADDGANTEAAAGVMFRESSTGKFITLEYATAQGTLQQRSRKWTNPSTFSADYAGINRPAIERAAAGALRWWRIRDDGTNRTYALSTDGQHFAQLFSVGHTDFCTPDQVGVFVRNWTGGTAGLLVLSWSVTTP